MAGHGKHILIATVLTGLLGAATAASATTFVWDSGLTLVGVVKGVVGSGHSDDIVKAGSDAGKAAADNAAPAPVKAPQ